MAPHWKHLLPSILMNNMPESLRASMMGGMMKSRYDEEQRELKEGKKGA